MGGFSKDKREATWVFGHSIKKGIVVVPNYGMNEEVKKGTEKSIFKQAGLE